jgi:hypothetical protein
MTTSGPTRPSGPPSRSVFYGFGAWVGKLESSTAASWWPDDPNNIGFDQNQLIKVDLAKNPAAYIAGKITFDEIEVDDAPAQGGLTKLGPTFPTGSVINGVWLESQFYANLKNKPAFPPQFMRCNGYELTTIVYWGVTAPGIARRYWGFHAEITAEQGSLAMCTIWTPGTSATQRPAGTWWVDLAQDADPIANGFTTIGVGKAPKQGALFLDAITSRGLGLAGPKVPPWLGGEAIPLAGE